MARGNLLIAALPRSGRTLLDLTPARYLELFHLSRQLANVVDAHPHQLRHGGASADALIKASDATLMDRGNWGSVKSILRYRKPARYIRCLSKFSRTASVGTRVPNSDPLARPGTSENYLGKWLENLPEPKKVALPIPPKISMLPEPLDSGCCTLLGHSGNWEPCPAAATYTSSGAAFGGQPEFCQLSSSFDCSTGDRLSNTRTKNRNKHLCRNSFGASHFALPLPFSWAYGWNPLWWPLWWEPRGSAGVDPLGFNTDLNIF